MENILKILLKKGYNFENISIEFQNEKIFIELDKPRYFIVMDLSKERIQYNFSSIIGKDNPKLISKEDLLDKIKKLKDLNPV